jgi:hypothetical protein
LHLPGAVICRAASRRRPAPTDDSRLLSLFRDWLELYRAAERIPSGIEGDKEFNEAGRRFDDLALEVIAKSRRPAGRGSRSRRFCTCRLPTPPMNTLVRW